MQRIIPEVLACVLTYSAPESLQRAIDAIDSQGSRPGRLIVLDNAGDPPVFTERLPDYVTVIRSPVNGGPAGGWADLVEYAQFDERWRFLWMMDDDCVPRDDSLEQLLGAAVDRSTPVVVMPQWVLQPENRVENYPAWCGFLIHRDIIADVGPPRRDFVWWIEDTEWLQHRIPSAGYAVIRDSKATVDHFPVRRRGPRPAPKVYYEVRNSIYYRTRIRPHWNGYRRLIMTLAKVLVRCFLDPGPRKLRLALFARGVNDGLRGRLGLRVELSERGFGSGAGE